MDDLWSEGFRSADRMAGLDFDHIRLTLAKLAQMHAASAVFIQKVRDFSFLNVIIPYLPYLITCRDTCLQRNMIMGFTRKRCDQL